MNTQADKTNENESQSIASEMTQKENGEESTFQFTDNRPQAIRQMKLQAMTDNSPRMKQLKSIQEMADNSLRSRSPFQFNSSINPSSQMDIDSMEQSEPKEKRTEEPEPFQLEEGNDSGKDNRKSFDVSQLKSTVDSRQDIKSFQLQAHGPKPNRTELPDNLKTGIENLSGYSMDEVKMYYNSDKPAQLQAHALAQGSEFHIGSGQETHSPHEAWHIVQQKQGRVKPTMQGTGGVNVNGDKGLEEAADVMGTNIFQNHNSEKIQLNLNLQYMGR